MQNDFEYSGIWFLPEDENNEVSGKLIYSAKDGITLELIGSLLKKLKTYSKTKIQ